MIARILVAYATQKGSTADIAEAIGAELRVMGHTVDVREMRTVKSLDGYEAVILGAPVYVGRIIEMGKFVQRHNTGLMERMVAAFAVGTVPVSKDEKQIEAELKVLQGMFASIQPVALTLFAGKIDPAKLSFMQKTMVNMVKSPVGDFRDWVAITAWTRDVANKMGL